uniref:Apple domain-containing protein n=1 Tax=Elaeophora elaphi TaxID=1147741 RepID=A0A0R3RJJ0_9BILA
MVYVNVTESDREEYHINRTEASTLLECTRKCHKDPRCFSLKYREVDALGCVLTDFSPESCLQITSVPVDKIKYDINTAITIDCIKCKLRKDLDTKELQISSESNDNDEPSPFAGYHCSTHNRLALCYLSMRCQEDIWFIVEEQSDSVSSDFFEETVKANSVRECAEKCFDDCCKVCSFHFLFKYFF